MLVVRGGGAEGGVFKKSVNQNALVYKLNPNLIDCFVNLGI